MPAASIIALQLKAMYPYLVERYYAENGVASNLASSLDRLQLMQIASARARDARGAHD
jgi:hypothetical protein